MIRWLSGRSKPVFCPEKADVDGLVAVGGDLRPDRLLAAYRQGVFPWYNEGGPVLWWSPDPRAIFELDGLHIARRLRRTLRGGKFQVTVDHDFAGVMRGCAERSEGTWITGDMQSAYQALFRMGHAHSVEIWAEGALAGGIYGVALGGFFAGESMFFRRADASKVALAHLVERLGARGFQLFDIQYLTDHTARLGAIEIPRAIYLERLGLALAASVAF
jgi:leucyl/phenylalanyl-tRNA--protein transferase